MRLIFHSRARHEYEIGTTYTAGVQLTGAEVKSLRQKHGSLTGSYIKMLQGELFLINAQINPYSFAADPDYDPKRTRKLLLNKSELHAIEVAMDQKKKAVVPLAFELLHNRIKLQIGLGKPLKKFEKKEVLKRRDQQRDVERHVRQSFR